MNGGFEQSPKLSEQTIDLADKLVGGPFLLVCHRSQIAGESKTVVIYPSVTMPELDSSPHSTNGAFIYLHRSFTARQIASPYALGDSTGFQTRILVAASIGNAYDVTDGQQALLNARKDTRYQWLAGL